HPLILRSAELEVVLDPERGLPYEYRLLKNSSVLRGEDSGSPIGVTVCRRDPWAFDTVRVTPEKHQVSKSSAEFHFRAGFQGSAAARFTVQYKLSGATLVATLEGIEEQPGFELIEVAMSRLVSVHESDSGAWLAHGDQGGNLAMLSQAKEGSLPPNTF